LIRLGAAPCGMVCAYPGIARPVRARRPRFIKALLFDAVHKNPLLALALSFTSLATFSSATFTPNRSSLLARRPHLPHLGLGPTSPPLVAAYCTTQRVHPQRIHVEHDGCRPLNPLRLPESEQWLSRLEIQRGMRELIS
jgi:hypothetical protein